MNNWFYAHEGEQKGPVSEAELARLAQTGGFLPARDLVWKEGMTAWKKVAEVPELDLSPSAAVSTTAPVSGARATSNIDPYQPPAANNFSPPSPEGDEPPEIEPGTSVIGITECISRAFALTKRCFGLLFAVWAIFFAITVGVSVVQTLIEAIAGVPSADFGDILDEDFPNAEEGVETPFTILVQIFTNLAAQLVSVFLTLGMTRFALNLMAGKPAEIGMVFGEGAKLWRGFAVSLLYGLMAGLGMILLIVPGIYFALKYSQAQTAIVDKDLGIMESFHYSASITKNNMWALLGLALLTILINLGGFLAFCFGLFFTIPLTWLAWLLAYRWLKHGPASMEDRGLLQVGLR